MGRTRNGWRSPKSAKKSARDSFANHGSKPTGFLQKKKQQQEISGYCNALKLVNKKKVLQFVTRRGTFIPNALTLILNFQTKSKVRNFFDADIELSCIKTFYKQKKQRVQINFFHLK